MSEQAKAKLRRRLDPVGTRRAILDAAVATFAERGYSGTAMGDVACAAGVTKSLVQYHFETKEHLWQAALEVSMQPFIDAVDRFLASKHTLADVAKLIRERFELFERRPETIRILGWASLEPSPLPQTAIDRAPKVWASVVQAIPKVDRRRMLVAMSALDGWVLTRRFKSGILGQDLTQPEMGAVVLEEIQRALLRRETTDETGA
jgi:AcrR family transcriptional regulator